MSAQMPRGIDPAHATIYETRHVSEAAALLCFDELRFVGHRVDGGFVVFKIEGDGRIVEVLRNCLERRELTVEPNRYSDELHRLNRIIRSVRDAGQLTHKRREKHHG